MTYEEAIKHIRSDMRGFATPDYFKAHYMAISALERQIPKKPQKVGNHYECSCGVWILFDDEIPNDNDGYCPRCGQAIDWSEEN